MMNMSSTTSPSPSTSSSNNDVIRKNVADYLRKKLKTLESVADSKRVEFFRGDLAVKRLLKSPYAASIPLTNEEAAIALLGKLLRDGFFMRAKQEKRKQSGLLCGLSSHSEQRFIASKDEVYIWLYELPSRKNLLIGISVLIIGVIVCLFPLWPLWAVTSVRYVAMFLLGVLAVFFMLLIFRSVLFLFLWICTLGKLHFWIFPNMNDEQLSVKDSFIPFYTMDYVVKEAEEKQKSS